MKSNFDEFNEDWPIDDDEFDSVDPDFEKFLLLSAYIDGEVTPSERHQVQEWLDSDPTFKQQYLQQLRLHQGINHPPVPTPSPASSQIADAVFQEIDQQNQHRRVLVGGGILIAAMLSVLIPNVWLKPSLSPNFATQRTDSLETEPTDVIPSEDSEGLVIALNQPIIELPANIQSDMD
ncbi:MAG: anti-sigma factor [Microcystaceae cyanobacterium]